MVRSIFKVNFLDHVVTFDICEMLWTIMDPFSFPV